MVDGFDWMLWPLIVNRNLIVEFLEKILIVEFWEKILIVDTSEFGSIIVGRLWRSPETLTTNWTWFTPANNQKMIRMMTMTMTMTMTDMIEMMMMVMIHNGQRASKFLEAKRLALHCSRSQQ